MTSREMSLAADIVVVYENGDLSKDVVNDVVSVVLWVGPKRRTLKQHVFPYTESNDVRYERMANVMAMFLSK